MKRPESAAPVTPLAVNQLRDFFPRVFAEVPAAFGDFNNGDAFRAAAFELFRILGILPIRGSPARTRSQAWRADSSKSGASTGRTCHPVTFFPKSWMDRILGNSRRRLS